MGWLNKHIERHILLMGFLCYTPNLLASNHSSYTYLLLISNSIPWLNYIIILCLISGGIFVFFLIKKQRQKFEHSINERNAKLEQAYKELLNKNQKIREQNRQIEKQQTELELKVAERTRELEIAKRKAEESDKLKSSFLANMSHEIRTPLNAITGFSTLVSSDLYTSEQKQKYVGIIKANAYSLLKLVEDILDLSKIEADQLKIDKDFFDLNALYAEIYAIFQEEIKNRKKGSVLLECSNILSQNSIRFFSDQIRIKQILVNLLSNALKFTSLGKIEFGYKLLDNKILFWVKDTGIGIKPEDLDTIFDRFMKIEVKKSLYGGTGLGLSISRSLVEKLGGKIWVESDHNIGSNFFFELPGKVEIAAKYEISSQKPLLKKINLKNKSVLIIEDEKSNYELLHSYLHATEAKIVWAQNGFIGRDYCEKKHFDFILLDIRMPDIDGYETLKLIRKIYPKLPVIAQTAYALPEDKQTIFDAGFTDYLIKPFSREELYAKIADVI